MKKICLSLVLLLSIQTGISQMKNFIDQPYLETTAEVDTLVTPDRVYLRIRLQESDSKGRKSIESLERSMGTKLKELGIDLEEQLTVSDLGSEFQKYFLRKQDILKEKVFELVLYDAKSTGLVLYELEESGIANVQLIKTAYSDMESLEDALRIQAVQRVREQGLLMAKALGQTLGSALYISDRGANVVNKTMERGAMALTMDQEGNTYVPIPAEFDQIRVQLGVQAKFVLE